MEHVAADFVSQLGIPLEVVEQVDVLGESETVAGETGTGSGAGRRRVDLE